LRACTWPEVWTADADTEWLVVCSHGVTRLSALKNQVHSILRAHLIQRCPYADLFNRRGRDELRGNRIPPARRPPSSGMSANSIGSWKIWPCSTGSALAPIPGDTS
jgi:hypothetical protein